MDINNNQSISTQPTFYELVAIPMKGGKEKKDFSAFTYSPILTVERAL